MVRSELNKCHIIVLGVRMSNPLFIYFNVNLQTCQYCTPSVIKNKSVGTSKDCSVCNFTFVTESLSSLFLFTTPAYFIPTKYNLIIKQVMFNSNRIVVKSN